MSKHKQPSFIDPQALRELVRCDEKVVIVDVRPPEEFAAGPRRGSHQHSV